MVLLEAKSLRKAVVPSTLIDNPSPGNLQSTRLALHVNEDGSSVLVYIASGCHVYKLQIGVEDSFVSEGKEGLMIPEYTQFLDSVLLNRCPHRWEIQSIALAGTNSTGYLVLGSVDSFGHLIVSKLDTCGKGRFPGLSSGPYYDDFTCFEEHDTCHVVEYSVIAEIDVDRLTYSVLPPDRGIGEVKRPLYSCNIQKIRDASRGPENKAEVKLILQAKRNGAYL
ncbi:hypothetical protein JRO89_XSUnG0184000 [Xanthoceras sorbifolium]|uniref:Cleavage/polyadenylation specificity factor A subunit N-terminal domain-containing protein n=1 Tax=Xanthoceras sorbifolium TaxID=99658 RepID=A0ABQ8GZ91_9ROSI|nr:hypothetical protein JRO89_XSUnG0184000 [Xanthoceras sorbifolium]